MGFSAGGRRETCAELPSNRRQASTNLPFIDMEQASPAEPLELAIPGVLQKALVLPELSYQNLQMLLQPMPVVFFGQNRAPLFAPNSTGVTILLLWIENDDRGQRDSPLFGRPEGWPFRSEAIPRIRFCCRVDERSVSIINGLDVRNSCEPNAARRH